jgi:hypothetical protein
MNSGQFFIQSATRSPGRTPKSCASFEATLLVWRNNVWKVISSSPQKTAALPACRCAESANALVRFIGVRAFNRRGCLAVKRAAALLLAGLLQ